MTSQAKIDANRENAKRSTGPKTPEGKAASRMNAVKHGLLASFPLIPGEEGDRLLEYREAMIKTLKPEGELEMHLVERIVLLSWRMRRAARVEAEILVDKMELTLPDALEGRTSISVGQAFLRDAKGADGLSKLSRYEAALDRALYRALHELQRLQAARRGAPVSLPQVLDVAIDLFDKGKPLPPEVAQAMIDLSPMGAAQGPAAAHALDDL